MLPDVLEYSDQLQGGIRDLDHRTACQERPASSPDITRGLSHNPPPLPPPHPPCPLLQMREVVMDMPRVPYARGSTTTCYPRASFVQLQQMSTSMSHMLMLDSLVY